MSMICCGTRDSRESSYRLHHTPPWLLSFLFAIQHLLVQTSLLCTCHSLFLQSHPLASTDQSRLLASSLFACGFATWLQSGLGTRLPLVQAPTFELLVPAIILSKYSSANRTTYLIDFQGSVNCSGISCENLQNDFQPIREVSGALVISGVLQIISGVFGIWGWIFQFCGPMVLAPAISIIGFSCYKPAALLVFSNWGVSLSLIAVTTLLSQTLRCLHFPVLTWKGTQGVKRRYVPVFHMLSMFLPIFCIWIVCTFWNPDETVFPSDVRLAQNTSSVIIHETRMSFHGPRGNSTELIPWFQFPTLGAWGWPRLSLESLAVGTAMALTSSMSSLGCYILCARLLCSYPLPPHACNRGIGMEGIGNVLSGVLGSVCGVASNVPSASIPGITQVGSRHSANLCALMFILLGCSPKLSEVLMSIPPAVHGGTLCLTFSIAVGGGVSFFQYANIDSGRNIFIVGFTMFMALLVPRWLVAMPEKLDTGLPWLNMYLLSLLTTPIFLGGLFSFILDNTVEGSLEERGLHISVSLWHATSTGDTRMCLEKELAQAYELPSVLARLFPTIYPCNQLSPPPPKSVVIVAGEDDKLLATSDPVTV